MNGMRAYTAEFIGTFGLIFIGVGSVLADSLTGGAVGTVGIALAHGIYLGIMITAVMRISGGHINPAVTFGVFLSGRMSVRSAMAYWIAQLAGAVLAALCLTIMFPAVDRAATHLGTPMLAAGVGPAAGILTEAILTFFLVFAVFGTAIDPEAPSGIGGFAIGLTVTVDILAGGAITGASMNPARAFGPALISGTWEGHLVYWVGPLLGAMAASLVYGRYLMRPKGEA